MKAHPVSSSKNRLESLPPESARVARADRLSTNARPENDRMLGVIGIYAGSGSRQDLIGVLGRERT